VRVFIHEGIRKAFKIFFIRYSNDLIGTAHHRTRSDPTKALSSLSLRVPLAVSLSVSLSLSLSRSVSLIGLLQVSFSSAEGRFAPDVAAINA